MHAYMYTHTHTHTHTHTIHIHIMHSTYLFLVHPGVDEQLLNDILFNGAVRLHVLIILEVIALVRQRHPCRIFSKVSALVQLLCENTMEGTFENVCCLWHILKSQRPNTVTCKGTREGTFQNALCLPATCKRPASLGVLLL